MEKIYSAKTLDEAKASAYEFFTAAGFEESDINFEIIEQPVKKLFGTKGEYRVRAIADDILLNNTFTVQTPATQKRENPPLETPIEKNSLSSAESDEIFVPADEEKYAPVVDYLTRILTALGAEDFKINVIQKKDITVLDIVGDKLGIVIGRRGETLDSLQYLVILANNRKNELYTRISVDCNGYREKRCETLESLATRTAHKVLKQGRRVTLEPMNPYERRIIHSKVAEIEGVYSNSIGDEPYRKVVVSANVVKPRKDRDFKRDFKDAAGRNDNKDNKPRDKDRDSDKRAQSKQDAPITGKSYKQSSGFSTSFEREYKRTPSEPVEISQDTVDVEKNTSLYGKIEL